MPNKARRLCSHPLCGNWMPCTTHAPSKHAPYASSRRRERIGPKGSGWQQQRNAKAVMWRDDGICGICGRPGSTEVDHIIPICDGGDNTLDNMQPVHKDCHLSKSQEEAQRARKSD